MHRCESNSIYRLSCETRSGEHPGYRLEQATARRPPSLAPTLYWGTAVTLSGEGVHALYAEAEDRFGQVSAPSDVVTVTLDTTPPTGVSIVAEVENDYVVLTWGASDPVSGLDVCTLEVREDAGWWEVLSGDCDGTTTYADVWAGRDTSSA